MVVLKASSENEQVLPLHREDVNPEKPSFNISHLPPEILRLIFLKVYKSYGSGCLATILSVSRHWYEIGSLLLWQNLVLADSSIEKFAGAIARTSTESPLIHKLHSLTLEIVSPDDNASNSVFTRDTRLLASILPSLTKLRSFSVTSRYGVYSPWLTKQATDDVIIDLVSNLPKSLQHLEVDLQIAYFPRIVPESCLCETISRRLEGLHSLRLRWPRICSKLFSRPSTTLTHVSMDYAGAGLSPYVRGCVSARSNSRMSWDELQQQSHRLSQAAVRDVLRPLREDPRTLPNIQYCAIIEPHHFWPLHSNHQWFLLNVHTISEADSPRLITFSYPIWPTGFIFDGNYQFIMRRCIHDNPGQSQQIINHDCSDTDCNGSGRAMCRTFEHTAGWTTSETGARHPIATQLRALFNATNAFLDKKQWQVSYAETRKEDLISEFGAVFIEEPSPTMDLNTDIEAAKNFHEERQVKATMVGADYIWFLEDRLGHNVLCARTHLDDFDRDSDDLIQEKFTSAKDLLREVQRDVPWSP